MNKDCRWLGVPASCSKNMTCGLESYILILEILRLDKIRKPIKHENLFLDGFKNRIKLFILNLQSEGNDIHWEPNNFQLYNFTNRDLVLRSDTLL